MFKSVSASFSARTGAQLREKRQALLAIQNPRDFFDEIKKKGTGVSTLAFLNLVSFTSSYHIVVLKSILCTQNNAASPRNLLHLMKRCTSPADIYVASRGVTYFQRKGVDFSHLFCSYFVNLCAQADKPKLVADMIVEPRHRIGAWVSKKSNKTLLDALAKTDDVETMVKVVKATHSKGLAVQTKESWETMMSAAVRTKNAANHTAVLDMAKAHLSPEEVAALAAQFPAPADDSK